MLRTADSPWLVSSWLMEWEGKLIYGAKRRHAAKSTNCIKSCSVGVSTIWTFWMFLWVCVLTRARTRKHGRCKLCVPLTTMHACTCISSSNNPSFSLSVTHIHKNTTTCHFCVFVGCVSVKSDRSLSKPEWAQRYKYTPGNISQK